MHFAEARIGAGAPELRAYNWSDLLDLGVPVATGTDYSVSPYNPFYTLHAASHPAGPGQPAPRRMDTRRRR